jgi:hypothetical protein
MESLALTQKKLLIMKTTNLEDLKKAYFELSLLKEKHKELLAVHNAVAPFSNKKVFHTQSEYDEYLLHFNEYWKADDDRKQSLKMSQFDIELKEKEVLELIPLKAVWFNLPGTSIYLAKTSNNSMDKDGRNLHGRTFENSYEWGENGVTRPITVAQIEALLPKLETL